MNRREARATRLQQLQIMAQRQTDDSQWIPTTRVVMGRNTSGVRINADNALTISAAWACCRYLSQGISVLPWRVMKPDDQGDASTPAGHRHAVQKLLWRPSREWSGTQFRETMMWWALRRGNAYAEIERDMAGRPIALWPIHPERVEVARDIETGELFYKVDNSPRADAIVEAMDMFHLRGLGEGPVGLNVIQYAAETLGWVKAAQLFSSSFFGGGATPAGVVTMKKPLSPEGLVKLEKRFHQLYGGPRGQNKTVFLDNEMDYQSITTDPNKAQFIETNQHLIDEVCRIFGVPPHKIYHLLRATFSNIEHQSIEVVQDSLLPWAKRFQDEADYKLFGTENRQGFFTKIDMKGILAGDTKARLEWYRGLREAGIMSADEIRALEEMAPIGKSEGGEKYTLQGQYTTLDKIGEEPPEPVMSPGDRDEPGEPEKPEQPVTTPEEDQANAAFLAGFYANVIRLKDMRCG